MGICCGLLILQIKYIDTFIKLDAVKLEFKNHRILELLSMLWINSNENFQDSVAIIIPITAYRHILVLS